MSSYWHWSGASSKNVKERLRRYLKTRGEISHRVSNPKKLTEKEAKKFREFIYKLSVLSNNTVRTKLYNKTKQYPWNKVKYGTIK